MLQLQGICQLLKGPIGCTGALLTSLRVTCGAVIEEFFLSPPYLCMHTVSVPDIRIGGRLSPLESSLESLLKFYHLLINSMTGSSPFLMGSFIIRGKIGLQEIKYLP